MPAFLLCPHLVAEEGGRKARREGEGKGGRKAEREVEGERERKGGGGGKETEGERVSSVSPLNRALSSS